MGGGRKLIFSELNEFEITQKHKSKLNIQNFDFLLKFVISVEVSQFYYSRRASKTWLRHCLQLLIVHLRLCGPYSIVKQIMTTMMTERATQSTAPLYGTRIIDQCTPF
jgi:hypothetical protein